MPAVEDEGDVDVDDVAFLQRLFAGNAVADHVIDRGAGRFLVAAIHQGCRQRAVIERTPTRHALRWAGPDEPLFATNDYRLLFKPQAGTGSIIYETTCTRYEALCRFFAGHRPDRDVEDEELLGVLSDPAVIQSITAQHILMRPRTGAIRLFVPRRLLNN